MRISAVMPAYNEEQNIEKMVRYCMEVLRSVSDDFEIVVTNDGSKDGTGEILNRLEKEFSELTARHHDPKQGYGAAMITAIQSSSGDIVITIDSDGQFDLGDIRRMMPLFNSDIDILTGYREAKKDSLVKVLGDRVMNLLIRVVFRVQLRDTNCALKLCRGSLIRSMNLEARGFQLPTEIMLKAMASGHRIVETPVTHTARKGGQSSLAPLKTGWQMLVFLFYLRLKITLFKKGILRSL